MFVVAFAFETVYKCVCLSRTCRSRFLCGPSNEPTDHLILLLIPLPTANRSPLRGLPLLEVRREVLGAHARPFRRTVGPLKDVK